MSEPRDIRQVLSDNAIRDFLSEYEVEYSEEANYNREERPPIEPFWSELQSMDNENPGTRHPANEEQSWYEHQWRRAEEEEQRRQANIDEDFLRELRNMVEPSEDQIIVDYYGDTPQGRDIWGMWLRVGPKPYPRRFVRELAHKLWEQAGRPEGRSNEFWFEAEKALDKRGFAAAGVGGLCPIDSQIAKQEAIKQFLRRREYAIKQGQIDNSSLPAGFPMYFYCTHCGILLETLPEEYIFRPRRQCSQCKGLSEIRWLQEAKEAAQKEGLPLPTPSKYHEVRKQGGETS